MSRNIYIISVGIGEPDLITLKGKRILEEMDIIAGFPMLKDFVEGKPFYEIKTIEELEELVKHHFDKKIGVLVSGDAGFFSFAKKVYEKLSDSIADVTPGVSTFQYAFAKIRQTYEDVKFYSFHARCQEMQDILKGLMESENKLFFLLKDLNQLQALWDTIKYHPGKCTYFGDLNTKNEIITEDLDEILLRGCKKIAFLWRKNG